MQNNRNIDPDYINNRIDGHPQRPNNNILPPQKNLSLSQKIWGHSDADITLQHHTNTNIVTTMLQIGSTIKFTKDLYNQNFSTGIIEFIAHQKTAAYIEHKYGKTIRKSTGVTR